MSKILKRQLLRHELNKVMYSASIVTYDNYVININKKINYCTRLLKTNKKVSAWELV